MALQQSGDCQSNSAGNGDGINKDRHDKKQLHPNGKPETPVFFFLHRRSLTCLYNSKVDSADAFRDEKQKLRFTLNREPCTKHKKSGPRRFLS